MWWCPCIFNNKVAINEIHDIMDLNRADKYGISIERYKRILKLPHMNCLLIDNLYEGGWDFTDTSLDIHLFSEMHHIIQDKSTLKTINEE